MAHPVSQDRAFAATPSSPSVSPVPASIPLRGPRWSVRVYGDGEDAHVVAADLSPTMREILLSCPDEDFQRTGYLKKVKILDSAIKRFLIERCGYHRAGEWQYRLTDYGRAVRDAAIASEAAA